MSINEYVQDEAERAKEELTSSYKLEDFKRELRALALAYGIPRLINQGNFSINNGEEFDFTEEIIDEIAECYTQEEPRSELMDSIYGSIASYHKLKG
jgi:hypothetical protein